MIPASDVELVEFKAWQSIPRLRRNCVITEKLDGTNGIVYVNDESNGIIAGSRSRWLSEDKDNYGFWRWCSENEQELVKLGPGYHYGEWWGLGIQRRYSVTEKRFSLFNVGRWEDAVTTGQFPSCVSLVPKLYQGPFSDEAVNSVISDLKANGSKASPGFMDVEGIVIFLSASHTLFKYTLDGDGHKNVKGALEDLAISAG